MIAVRARADFRYGIESGVAANRDDRCVIRAVYGDGQHIDILRAFLIRHENTERVISLSPWPSAMVCGSVLSRTYSTRR